MDYKLLNIKTVETKEDGALSFFQCNDDVDFDIMRIYYIHSANEGVVRGKHAHKNLKQLLFCPFGSIQIILDDGITRTKIELNKPNLGLLIGPSIWREMKWIKRNSVLCVAASMKYDEQDYIRNYDDFLQYTRGVII